MVPSMPPLIDTKIGKEHGPVYQSAVEYGIDVYQLEYLLTLTPAERLTRLYNHQVKYVLTLTADLHR